MKRAFGVGLGSILLVAFMLLFLASNDTDKMQMVIGMLIGFLIIMFSIGEKK